MKRKLKIAREEKLKLITLYPKDLFPRFKFNEIFDFLIR